MMMKPTLPAPSRLVSGLRLVRSVAARADGTDPRRLRRRMRIARNWNIGVDGRAPRLSPRQTIDVTRHGRFAEVDPLETSEGWRNGAKAVAVAGWITACAAAAALGYWGGRGPMAALRRDEETPEGHARD